MLQGGRGSALPQHPASVPRGGGTRRDAWDFDECTPTAQINATDPIRPNLHKNGPPEEGSARSVPPPGQSRKSLRAGGPEGPGGVQVPLPPLRGRHTTPRVPGPWLVGRSRRGCRGPTGSAARPGGAGGGRAAGGPQRAGGPTALGGPAAAGGPAPGTPGREAGERGCSLFPVRWNQMPEADQNRKHKKEKRQCINVMAF